MVNFYSYVNVYQRLLAQHPETKQHFIQASRGNDVSHRGDF